MDVDGTLLEFADEPAAVRVPVKLLGMLDQLHEALNGAFALVSGRSLQELDQLFHRPQWLAAGCHGLQYRDAQGRCHTQAQERMRPLGLRRGVDTIAANLPGVYVEDKGSCIALHCRQAPQHEAALAKATAALARRFDGFAMQPGNKVFEIKPAGSDKGQAVLALLGELPFCDRVPVYLGDDLTDEYAFAVINEREGISVRVGSRTPTQALFTLDNVSAVHTWLRACLGSPHAPA